VRVEAGQLVQLQKLGTVGFSHGFEELLAEVLTTV
jgi:hypothetical protein